MKIIFVCGLSREISIFDQKSLKMQTLSITHFLPSSQDLRQASSRANIFFYEPFVPLLRIKDITTEYEIIENLEQLNKITENKEDITIFIDFSGCRSIPQFLISLNRTFSDNELYIFLAPSPYGPRTDLEALQYASQNPAKEFSLNDILDLNLKSFAGCFNPFKEFKLRFNEWNEYQREDNLRFLEDLSKVAETFCRLGFSQGKILTDVEISHWSCNVEITAVKLLQKYFEIFPTVEYRFDIPIDEFCDREPFRRILTEYVCKIVANIAVANNLISRKINWSNYDPEVYLNIYNKIKDIRITGH
jgi:hypothetical protein